MIILLIILIAFGLLTYFTVFKKDKPVNPTSDGGDETQIFCKRYRVKIYDQSKVENLAWVGCDNMPQGGVAKDGNEICVKTLIYHNQTNLELIDLGYCN